MLAKMWKKVLLAVCIIACLFNLMSKLVNRHSLKTNLESVNDGTTVLDSIRSEEKKSNTEKKDVIIDEEGTTAEEDSEEAEESEVDELLNFKNYKVIF